MVLADWQILKAIYEGIITITPITNAVKQIGSTSIDLRLGTEFKIIRRVKQTHFDILNEKEKLREQISQYTEIIHLEPIQPFILHPDEFALASTLEYIVLPKYYAGRLEGRSTWGRVGLQVHSTAGLVDPGYEGTLTFELHNMGKLPLTLFPGVRIAQISILECKDVCEKYTEKEGEKYSKSVRSKDAMFYEDYEYENIKNKIKKNDE